SRVERGEVRVAVELLGAFERPERQPFVVPVGEVPGGVDVDTGAVPVAVAAVLAVPVVDGSLIVLVDHHLASVRLDHGAVRIGPGLTGLNGRFAAPGPRGQVRRAAAGPNSLARS